MFFTHTSYRIIIKTNLDLTTASSLTIEYRGPDGVTGNWTAKADLKSAFYDTTTSSITEPGLYKFQLVAVINGNTRRGDIVQESFATPL